MRKFNKFCNFIYDFVKKNVCSVIVLVALLLGALVNSIFFTLGILFVIAWVLCSFITSSDHITEREYEEVITVDDDVNDVSQNKDDNVNQYAYVSKYNGKEYRVSIFKDNNDEKYRIVELNDCYIFPFIFDTYGEAATYINDQSDYIVGLNIYGPRTFIENKPDSEETKE